MAGTDIRLVAHLRVKPGQIDPLTAGVREVVDVTDRQNSALSYEWYLNDDATECHAVEHYANSDAFLAHMQTSIGIEILPRLRDTWDLTLLDVYGDLSPQAEAEFRAFAGAILRVFRPLAGYTR
jgi:quinol monooxygenase YgiN